MGSQNLFQRYVWLINLIIRYRYISFEDICEEWLKTDLSLGKPLYRSSFNRYREAVEDIFGILIECDRRNNKYYIVNENDIRSDAIQKWMVSTMTINNLLAENKGIHDRVLLESVPSAEPYLGNLMKAMKQNLKVKMGYQKYNSAPSPDRVVEPFCVKVYRRRWYLLARIEDGNLRTFSLDRIRSLELTDEHFKLPEDFDAEDFFMNTAGIVLSPTNKKERIVVRAFGNGRFYLKDLPYHPSQKLIAETDKYADFEYHFIPNSEFIRDILGQETYRQVIEPQWLADKIRMAHEKSAEMYK